MCQRHGCYVVPLSATRVTQSAVWSGDLRPVRTPDRGAASADTGSPVGAKDRGKTYWRQVWETVWVAAAFGSGIILGAWMAGAK